MAFHATLWCNDKPSPLFCNLLLTFCHRLNAARR
jgi:hypothetical protein